MKLQIKVIAKARENKVEKIGENYYKVKVTAAAEKGKANEAVREVLAKHFGVKKYQVEITSGFTIPDKFVEINNL
jgi:uncharacterized protein (TIGR00251 family)